MGDEKKQIALHNLIVACLLGEGEKTFSSMLNKNKELICPFSIDKAYYLFNYINQYQLMDEVIVEQKKNQFRILLSNKNFEMIEKWYDEDGEKIFKKYFGNTFLSYESIIISINLFGKRKVEGIGISTTISTKHLQTLAHSVKKTINQYVYTSNKYINIPDIVDLCKNHVPKLTALDSAEMVNYLQAYEKEVFIMEKQRSGV